MLDFYKAGKAWDRKWSNRSHKWKMAPTCNQSHKSHEFREEAWEYITVHPFLYNHRNVHEVDTVIDNAVQKVWGWRGELRWSVFTQCYSKGWPLCHLSSLVRLQLMAWEKHQKQEEDNQSKSECMDFISLFTVHTRDKLKLGHWGSWQVIQRASQ